MEQKALSPKQLREVPEELSDILLVMDMVRHTIGVASQKNGKPVTVPVKEKERNAFLKIDKSSILENFISNYLRQAKDPAHFRFFRIPLSAAKNSMRLFRELLKPDPSKEAADFARRHEVKQAKHQTGENESNQTLPSNNQNSKINNKINNQNSEDMSTYQSQTQAPAQAEASKYRFQEERINWGELKKFGISKEYLREKKLLDDMMKGYKSREAVPIAMNFGSAILRTDARLSFQQDPGGQVVLSIHGMRRQPELDKPYFGHVFSEEDKKNLKETGNMGRTVELTSRTGETAPYMVSIDRITNEIMAVRADRVFIPDEISGVKLSKAEKEDLREGKAIHVEGMLSKTGREFNATLQVNAEKRGVEYIFDRDGQFNRQEIGGVKLTDKQLEDLNAGKAIFVEDMRKKNGELTSSFIRMNEKGALSFTNYNPDSPEGNREIYIPKEICGVPLTPADRDSLREGKPVFLDGMTGRNGEEFSSFVKIDTETGRVSYAKTPDGFAERPQFKIPAESWGHTFTATERAALQDGKAIYVENMKGFNGQFSSWLKVNENKGQLDFYPENPDKPKQASAQQHRQDGQSVKPEKVQQEKVQEKAGKSSKRMKV